MISIQFSISKELENLSFNIHKMIGQGRGFPLLVTKFETLRIGK